MDHSVDEAIRQLREQFGWSSAEQAAFTAAITQPSPPAIRLQRGTDRSSLPYRLHSVPWSPAAFWWHEPYRPGATRHFAAGSYYIQDPSSLLALELLDIRPDDLAADLCAAPGGKATAILDALGPDGFLLINEPIHNRLAPLLLNLARQGTPQFTLTSADIAKLKRFENRFDAVLIDVPCSGQSLLSKQRQSTQAFSTGAIEHCAGRQTRILQHAARLVRPGGRLVYATCTFAKRENEDQIEQFLQRNADWHIEPVARLHPWESPLLAGSYRLWPHHDQVAGTFAVRLRRRRESAETESHRSAQRSDSKTPRIQEVEPHSDDAKAWGRLEPAGFWQMEHLRFATSVSPPPELTDSRCHGPEVAHRRGRTWFPSHALALRKSDDWKPHQIIELDDRAAALYLRGEILPHAPDGWSVACWRQLPLGWVKGDRGRGKNRLPKSARLAGLIETEPS